MTDRNKEDSYGLISHINSHIKNLNKNDIGAYQVRKEDGVTIVDIEWGDGVSAFSLQKVLNLISEKGYVTKSELIDKCLA